MLIMMLFSFSAEAGIPLTMDNPTSPSYYKKRIVIEKESKGNKDSKIKAKKNKVKSVPTQSSSSFFGPLTPGRAALIESIEDDYRRLEYLRNKDYTPKTWIAFTNARLKYYIEYPDILTKELNKPENEDGLWLQSSDGYIKLTTLGDYNTQSAKEILETISAKYKRNFLVKKSGKNWYRFVYRKGDDVIHRYGIVNDDKKAEFILGYPIEKREEFEAITKQMEKTLTFEE